MIKINLESVMYSLLETAKVRDIIEAIGVDKILQSISTKEIYNSYGSDLLTEFSEDEIRYNLDED